MWSFEILACGWAPGALVGDDLEFRATRARLDAVRAHRTSAYDSRYSSSFFIVVESIRLH